MDTPQSLFHQLFQQTPISLHSKLLSKLLTPTSMVYIVVSTLLSTCCASAEKTSHRTEHGADAGREDSGVHASTNTHISHPLVAPDDPRFNPAVVVPEMGSPLASARAALAAAQFSEVLRIAAAQSTHDHNREHHRDRDHDVLLHWLAARASMASGDHAVAIHHWTVVAESEHALAPWGRLEKTSAQLQLLELEAPNVSSKAEKATAAANTAAALAEQSWAGRGEARWLAVRAWRLADNMAQAVPWLEKVARDRGRHAAEAAVLLAEHAEHGEHMSQREGQPALALDSADDSDDVERALAWYRHAVIQAPRTRRGRAAQASMEALLERVPEARREALRVWPIKDAFALAEKLYAGTHYARAEDAFAQLSKRLVQGSAERCRAELMQGKSMVRRRGAHRARGGEWLVHVAARCRSLTTRPSALYNAGKAFDAAGQNAKARTQYTRLQRDYPAHRLSDDAAYRLYLIATSDGDHRAAQQQLETLIARYPDGDMRGDALFRLAWDAWKQRQHARALRWLDRARREGPGEHREDLAGRVDYWRARTLAAIDDGDRVEEAKKAYRELCTRWPLSYYAQQAWHRLRELEASSPTHVSAAAVLASWRDTHPQALLFPRRSEMQQPEFLRAIALFQLGEPARAKRELNAMGALGASSDRSMRWLAAALLSAAGDKPASTQLVRRRLASFRRTAPNGVGRRYWELAYPTAFAPLIEEAAARESIPSSFVRAIAREESSFNPKAVSWAHAYGLVQIILPTARPIGRELNLNATAATLQDPETNLRIGARYMHKLFTRFKENPALVPAGYNAGPGAVARWLRQDNNRPLDAFVEEIPYAETQRYTRRVLQSYGVYQWLTNETLPELRPALKETPSAP